MNVHADFRQYYYFLCIKCSHYLWHGASFTRQHCLFVITETGFPPNYHIPGRFIEIPDGMSIAFSTLAVGSASPYTDSLVSPFITISLFKHYSEIVSKCC